MTGGSITQNQANMGGGFYLADDEENTKSFTMEGGLIADNVASKLFPNPDFYSNGIYVQYPSTLYFNGTVTIKGAVNIFLSSYIDIGSNFNITSGNQIPICMITPKQFTQNTSIADFSKFQSLSSTYTIGFVEGTTELELTKYDGSNYWLALNTNGGTVSAYDRGIHIK